MTTESRYVKTSISLTKEQMEWVHKHPSLNLSGLLQEAIDEEIEQESRTLKKGKETPQTAEIQGVPS